ncbi:hypothetical protein [Roseibium sp. M-1]
MLIVRPDAFELLEFLSLDDGWIEPELYKKIVPDILASINKRPEVGVIAVEALLDKGQYDFARELFEEIVRTGRIGRGGLLRSFSAIMPRELSAPELENLGQLTFDDLRQRECRHRLLVMSERLPPSVVRRLVRGAEEVTMVLYGDLYGKIDLKEIRHAVPNIKINIEHARTRADRFDDRYYEIHKRTAECAKFIVDANIRCLEELAGFGRHNSLLAKLMSLELADTIFFKSLRNNAVLSAIKDAEFDDIIIEFGRNAELYRVVSSLPGIFADSRVRGCCWSDSRKVREGHITRLRSAHKYISDFNELISAGVSAHRPTKYSSELKRYLESVSYPRRKGGKYFSDRPMIVLASSLDRAYLNDAAKMAIELCKSFNVDIMWGEVSSKSLEAALLRCSQEKQNAGDLEYGIPGVINVAAPVAKIPPSIFRDFLDLCGGNIQYSIRYLIERNSQDPAVCSALLSQADTGIPRTLLAAIGRMRAGASAIREHDYKTMLICSARTATNAQQAIPARYHQIPTIAVESHCLNASYCRYASIFTDKVALFSKYFSEEYERYFGISQNNAYPIGSPRFIRPLNYDPIQFRREARNKLELHNDDEPLVFLPTQPLPSQKAADAVRRTVKALRSIQRPLRLIIKPHPEEGSNRVDLYRSVIREEDCQHFVEVLEGADFRNLLYASSMVLVFYSVTAIEAAILERPVAIIGFTNEDYPVPYHSILNVPFCVSESEISSAVLDVIEHGASSLSSAANFRQSHEYLLDQEYFSRLSDVVNGAIAGGANLIRSEADFPATPFVTAPFKPYFGQGSKS